MVGIFVGGFVDVGGKLGDTKSGVSVGAFVERKVGGRLGDVNVACSFVGTLVGGRMGGRLGDTIVDNFVGTFVGRFDEG